MKLGIVAGGGSLPVALAEHCSKNDLPFHIFPITGSADPSCYNYPHDRFRLGAGGTFIRNLRRRQITDLVLIGFHNRPTLWQLRPDLFTLTRILPKLGLATRGDDGVLRALIALLEKFGRVTVRGIQDFMPALLAAEGAMGRHVPGAALQQAIETGIAAALDHGRNDAGQAVIAGADRVYLLEQRSGTDALLRAFASAPQPDAVLVKLCKPQQDRRVDLPTIGTRTIRNAAAAGIKGIVVSGNKTLIDNKQATIAAADAAGLFLVGVAAP